MENSISLSRLEENLVWFRNLYDSVRLVDPIEKKVIEYRHYNRNYTENICYDYWGKGKICESCISTRAYLYNKCFIKLEHTATSIMVVIAMPVEGAEKPLVIELLKNATDSIVVDTIEPSRGCPIHNTVAELNELIIKDELTGLYNRRYIFERLPADIVKNTMDEGILSVIFIDIDSLKEVNDTFGHIYGDKTINKVANLISNNIQNEKSWAARYGGDEFFICLNNTNFEEAYSIADSIRESISKLKIQLDGKTIYTTASLGVHTISGSSTLTAEGIIDLADKKMYEAKRRGKNCTAGFNKSI